MSKKHRQELSKFERLLYVFTIIIVLCFPVCLLFSQSQLTKVNYEVERAKNKVSIQEKTNESLQMKINELASLDNLEEVAKSKGLSYNNKSIKTIE